MALPSRIPQNYVDPMDQLNREFNTVLNRFFSPQHDNGGSRLAPYGVDVREDADHIFVEAELPGFRKEDVEITLERNTLTIAAERKQTEQPQDKEQGGEWLLRERRYSRFLRSFTLPPTVDEKTVDAKLTDGVLRITLHKRQETKPRKISVG